MQPKISVIIPIYNVEKYLRETLESVINQTLKEIEIILVNDGSTDNSLEIAEEYKRKDQRIKLINQENSGLSVARNVGIENSTGQYILFVDSDDYLELNTLNECYNCYKNKKVDLIYFEARPFLDGINKKINYNCYQKQGIIEENRIYSGEEFLKICLKNNIYTPSACLYLIRKDLLKDLRFFPKIYHEDDLFTTKLLLKVEKVYYIAKKFYNRRYRIDSITTKKISLDHIRSRYIIFKELEKLLLEQENEKKELIRKVIRNEINIIVSSSMFNSFEENKYYKNILLKNYKDITIKNKIKLKLKILYKLYLNLKKVI